MAYQSTKYGSLDFSKSRIGLNNVGNTPYAVEYGDYLYIPESTVNKGVVEGGTSYYFPYFLDQKNVNKFSGAAEPIKLSDLPYGDKIASGYGVGSTGYLVPKSIGFDGTNASVPAGWGTITGLSMKDGQLVYGTTGRSGDRYGWVSNSGVGSQPPPKKSGGILGLVENIGSALVDAGPIVKLAALVSGNPYLYAVSAGTDIAQGNYLSAAMSIAGAGGNIPGVDAATAADLKTAQTTLQISNAIKNDNPIAALSALGGLSGTALPTEVVKGAQLLAINSALQRGDLSALAVAAGNISNTPELSYAGKAANVVKAIETGDLSKISSSLQGFLPELRSAYKTGDITSAFDKLGYKLSDTDTKLLDSALTTPVDSLVQSGVDTVNDNNAKAGGWDNYAQLQDAAGLGIATKDEYTAYKAAEAQAAEEALAAEEARKAKEEADAQAAAEAARKAQEEADAKAASEVAPKAPVVEIEPELGPNTNLETEPDVAPAEPVIETEPELGPPEVAPEEPPSTEDEPTPEEPQCAEGWHWNGSMCIADDDNPDDSTNCPEGYILDLNTQTCVMVGSTTPTTPKIPSAPKTPTFNPPQPPKPTQTTSPSPTINTPPSATTAPAKTDNSANLLALLALADQPPAQQPQPVPLADIKYYYDFGDDLMPQKPQNTQNTPFKFGFFDGGEVQDLSVDDLIRMLQGD
jgi:hypothetical protein